MSADRATDHGAAIAQSAGDASPMRPFNCLWCGRPHTPRAADDLEVFARLCPDCIGRAQDNDFLRFRLREGLRARSAAAAAERGPADAADAAALKEYYAARAAEYDEVYLKHGPLESLSFQAELDAATLWLDGLPLSGEIVELAAGTGWWSPLLALKGELWLYDAVEEPLDLARRRLVAHDLRAHIHVRDAWAEPDRQVDGLFCGFWLSHVRRARLADFMALARRWLKSGGVFAFIDEAPEWVGAAGADETEARTLSDGRQFSIVKVRHSADELAQVLREAGFADVQIRATGRHFLLGQASAP